MNKQATTRTGSRRSTARVARLEHRCALFENMLAAAEEIMLCVDPSQRIVFANAAAARAFGYTRHEFERMPLETLIPQTQRARHAQLVQDFHANPGSLPRPMAGGRVVAARRRDGAQFPFEVTLTRPAPAADGRWVAAIGRDVTEREAAAATLAQQRARLRDQALALQSSREAERGRIARELHENLGQSIAAMNLDIAWVEQHATADITGLNERLQQMRHCVETVLGALRRLSSELRPLMLDDLGLAATLEWLANQALQRHGIKVDVRCTIDAKGLDEPVHSSLYRVAEEILQYLGRSASVRQVVLSVEQTADAVQVGIRAEPVPQADMPPDRALMGVHERMALLGGRIEIEHANNGMNMRVSIPLSQAGAAS